MLTWISSFLFLLNDKFALSATKCTYRQRKTIQDFLIFIFLPFFGGTYLLYLLSAAPSPSIIAMAALIQFLFGFGLPYPIPAAVAISQSNDLLLGPLRPHLIIAILNIPHGSTHSRLLVLISIRWHLSGSATTVCCPHLFGHKLLIASESSDVTLHPIHRTPGMKPQIILMAHHVHSTAYIFC